MKFLTNEDFEKQFYSAVAPVAERAKEQGRNTADTGIDLVATFVDGLVDKTIQCKFYAPNHVMGTDTDS